MIIISGPTAVGKTSVSIELAKKFQGVVVNFDSLLFYQELTIGTAKPCPAEQQDVPHYMLSISSIATPLNAASFSRQATPLIDDLLAQKKTVFLVGGSGFYQRALLQGMYQSTSPHPEVLQRSDELYQTQGITPFLALLKAEDPDTLQRVHINDHYRLRRACEHYWETGRTFSQATKTLTQAPTWRTLHFFLDLPKDAHAQVIAQRTEKMIQAGLQNEVQKLLNKGFTGQEKPLQSIGYKQTQDFIKQKISEQVWAEQINTATRQLAKAQRTWFKKIHPKFVFNPREEQKSGYQKINTLIKKFLEDDS